MPEKIMKIWGSKGANEPPDPHAWRYLVSWRRTTQGSLEVSTLGCVAALFHETLQLCPASLSAGRRNVSVCIWLAVKGHCSNVMPCFDFVLP